MNRQILLSAAILSVLTQSAHANPVSRRAIITGDSGNGRCTVEVSVDHAAEIEISGDTGLLTTTAGQEALWRRFQCNAPLPRKPDSFRVVRTGGRGTVRLVQNPRSTRGRAVIQINDRQGGRANYTFDLQWRGAGGGGWKPGPRPSPGSWGFPMTKAIRACQDSVTERLNRDGYSYINFDRTLRDDNPGRNDWVTGRVTANQGSGPTRFSFSCSVDFRSGRVWSVDVSRR
jgi:hypothetical protein